MAEKQISMNVSKDAVLCAKLLEIIEHTEQAGVNLKCDVCKNNAVMVLCTTCTQCLCKVCHKHHSEENNEHNIVTLDKASFCPEHKKSFEYYCEKCDKFACCSCKAKHSSVDNHNLGKIEETAIKHKNLLAEIVAPIDEISEQLSQIEAKLITAQKNLEEQLTEVEQSINSQYKVQIEKMKERHDLLKNELTNVVSQKKKVLLAHLEEVSSTQNEVTRVKKLFEDLKTSSGQKIISTKEQLEFHMQKIIGQSKNLSSKPVGSDLITFDPVTESAEILGQITTDVNHSEIIDLPTYITEDETSEFLILTKERNQYCNKGGSQVSIELTSSTGEVSAGEVRDNNDGSYTVSIKAEEVGEAKLSGYVNGLKIKGSPFSIEVIPSQDAPTKIVNCGGRMGTPRGIAFAKNDTGMWAVTDNTNCCVYILNNQNRLVRKFGQSGKEGKYEFNRPFGVAFDSNNHLYVVDGGTHRVKKFDANGKFLLQFGNKGNGEGELNGPYGVTTHTDKVYVADFFNKRISVFQTEGHFYFSFGSDHLAGPQDVAINTDKKLLFVTDNSNHKICIFTLDGHYVKEFGQQGHYEGQLNLPLGITTWNRKILVSDKNHRISIFSEDGQFVRCIGSFGPAEGQLNYPYGITSNLNSVYVADWVNQRVQIFNL